MDISMDISMDIPMDIHIHGNPEYGADEPSVSSLLIIDLLYVLQAVLVITI